MKKIKDYFLSLAIASTLYFGGCDYQITNNNKSKVSSAIFQNNEVDIKAIPLVLDSDIDAYKTIDDKINNKKQNRYIEEILANYKNLLKLNKNTNSGLYYVSGNDLKTIISTGLFNYDKLDRRNKAKNSILTENEDKISYNLIIKNKDEISHELLKSLKYMLLLTNGIDHDILNKGDFLTKVNSLDDKSNDSKIGLYIIAVNIDKKMFNNLEHFGAKIYKPYNESDLSIHIISNTKTISKMKHFRYDN